MICTPKGFKPLLLQIISTFRREDTARRLIFFCAAAILIMGSRTVSNVLRLLELIEDLNPSTYHRLFSHRRWSSHRVARAIATFVINRFATQDATKR